MLSRGIPPSHNRPTNTQNTQQDTQQESTQDDIQSTAPKTSAVLIGVAPTFSDGIETVNDEDQSTVLSTKQKEEVLLFYNIFVQLNFFVGVN